MKTIIMTTTRENHIHYVATDAIIEIDYKSIADAAWPYFRDFVGQVEYHVYDGATLIAAGRF